MRYLAQKCPSTGRTDRRTDGQTTRAFVYVTAGFLHFAVQTEDWNRSCIKMCSRHGDAKNYSHLGRREVLCSFDTELARTHAHSLVYNPLSLNGSAGSASAVALVPIWVGRPPICRNRPPDFPIVSSVFRPRGSIPRGSISPISHALLDHHLLS